MQKILRAVWHKVSFIKVFLVLVSIYIAQYNRQQFYDVTM